MTEIQPWSRVSFAAGRPLTHIVDAGFTSAPEYVASLGEALQPLAGNVKHFHELDFQTSAAQALVDHDPGLLALTRDVQKRVLGGKRFAVVTGMGFNALDSQTRDVFILGFNSLIGTPTVTSPRDKRVLWDVTPDPQAIQVHTPTFSETDGEADFHTDSTFRFPKPEQKFSLWTVNMDGTGNGVSSLIDGLTVQGELAATAAGIEALDILRTTKFPFNTPAAFTESQCDDELLVFQAPVLGDVVRWNKMGITNGARRGGEAVALTQDQQHAIALWESMLNRRDLVSDFMIPPDAVLFVNNHSLLHARSRIGDNKRHLIRVRMDPDPRYSR
jgi:hypothetical protein